ncbi:MAG: ArsA family ATPase [Chloroherpetonaceae bacterium]|nr:ArsA family ATPase [Chloroherpetonaceae bacterium]MDW8438686.1 ArsA family ATPase [Chloroherpetonaceae bacterium]
MRIILYLGKGGVGKTTISSASAVKAAREGKRTLILSTDIAHSLADALGRDLTDTPIEVEKNLFAAEVNILAEIRKNWAEFHDYFSSLLAQEGASEIVADELAIMPGMEEMVSLRHIWLAEKSGKYDVIIVDAAPTGETMRLLALPESYQWYASKIASWHLKTISFAYPLIQRLMPKKNIFRLMPEIGAHMRELHKTLQDPAITSFRIVLNPEQMVIKEALRAQTYLNLFGYTLDAAIINKIFPENSSDPYLQALVAQQKKYREMIFSCFYPTPVLTAMHREAEVIGADALADLAEEVFKGESPTKVFYHAQRTQEVQKENGKYLMKLYLPNVEIDRLQMNVKGDELLIEVNNFRKNIVLPSVLVGRKTEYAKYENGSLSVFFS